MRIFLLITALINWLLNLRHRGSLTWWFMSGGRYFGPVYGVISTVALPPPLIIVYRCGLVVGRCYKGNSY